MKDHSYVEMRVQVTRVYHAYVWFEWLSEASQSAEPARTSNFSTKKKIKIEFEMKISQV